MAEFKGLVDRIITEEDGQGMIEYALIGALLAVALIVAIGVLGDEIRGTWNQIGTALPGNAAPNTN